ncbi:glycosyltransferase family 2 protein [Georgenia thermotolerans]|uniref:Glycosyltransferase n=1 Tax=Georgenia thermotolerans TaxID=527326 RepID=A0A7J5UQ95_9MICO|nr:glycosyltransferase family 2 protein [Georgenia thermotolerans]KAE8764401.1 glycosyltransferase [Georgenia thermotolerans]
MEPVAPVTVVVPYFNAADSIARALDSVVAQSVPPAEIVVVDDGSDAEDAQRLRRMLASGRYGPVRLIALGENSGPSAARNAGWDAAGQPFIAFLDADDSWHPEKLQRQLDLFRLHPEASLIAHRGAVQAGSGRLEARLDVEPVIRRVTPIRLILRNQFGTPAVMIRSSVRARFDERVRYAEDRDLWMRLLVSGELVLVSSDQLAVYHKALYGAGGLSAQLWRMEKGELAVYWRLARARAISPALLVLAGALSLAKHARRLAIVAARTARRSGPDSLASARGG